MRRAGPLLALALGGCVAAPRATPIMLPHSEARSPAPPASPPRASPMAVIDGEPELSTVARLIHAGGLEPMLAGSVTVLAPSDDAWDRLAPGTLDALMLPGNRPSLRQLIAFLTLPARVSAQDLRARAGIGAALATSAGEPLRVTVLASGAIRFADAQGDQSFVTRPNLSGGDGLVHIVNGVLSPAALTP